MAASNAPAVASADPLSTRRLIATARSWLGFLIVGALIAAAISVAASLLSPAGFASRVTVMVAPAADAGATDYGDLQLAQALAPTYAEVAKTGPLLERVIESTGVDTDPGRLAGQISTRVPVDTALIQISVVDRDAETAAALANAIAAELVAAAPDAEAGPGPFQVALSVIDPASPPTVREGPGILVSALLAAMIGLFVSVTIALLVENLRSERI